jgi:hypothetical protein
VLEKAAEAVQGAVNGAPKLNIADDVTALIGAAASSDDLICVSPALCLPAIGVQSTEHR